MSAQVDEATVRQFIEIISAHARAVINGAGPSGVLQLSRLNPLDTNPVPSRFTLDDIENMVKTAVSDALAGVLWDVTSDYDVPLMVSRGMPSLTFLHASARAIRRAAQQGKRTCIYQFGDHDPSGVLIPLAIERRLEQMCERLDCPPPEVERVAL